MSMHIAVGTILCMHCMLCPNVAAQWHTFIGAVNALEHHRFVRAKLRDCNMLLSNRRHVAHHLPPTSLA
jgi:hypothetical protein